MSLVEAQGQEGVFGTPQIVDLSQAANVRFRKNSALLSVAHIRVKDVARIVAQYCAANDVSASRQRLMLAAVISAFEYDCVSDAIYGLIYTMASDIIEKVAHCSLENPDKHESVFVELGEYSEDLNVSELLDEANYYLPLIAGDILECPPG